MKCKISATALKGLIRSMAALQSLGLNTKEEDIRCLLTVRGEKLHIEGANMGAYIRRNQPVTMMREGSCGVNLKALSKAKFSGDVTLDFRSDEKQLAILAKNTKFCLPTEQAASDLIEASRPNTSKMAILAVIPAAILAEGAATVALKPALKEEDLQMQFSLSVGKSGGRIEIVGSEHYSFGRYVKETADIKVKEPFHFVLQSSSSSTVLKEITAETVGLGVARRVGEGEDGSTTMIRFASEDAEVVYPTLDVPYVDAQEQAQEIRDTGFECGFIAYRKQLREALSTLKPVQDSATLSTVLIKVAKGSVELGAKSSSGMVATAMLDTTSCKVTRADKPHIMLLSEKYISEVLNLSPDIVPLRVDSWSQRFVSVTAMKLADGEIEYLFSQVLPHAEAQKPDEAKK
jgi:DNA polymerase III sliding clamp (beta) subunit (PCNA family)